MDNLYFSDNPFVEAADGTLIRWISVESISFNGKDPEDTFDKLSGQDRHLVIRTTGGFSYRISALRLFYPRQTDLTKISQEMMDCDIRNFRWYWNNYLKVQK